MLTEIFLYKLKCDGGFSLIELLITLLFGSVLLTMVISLYVTGVSTGSNNLKLSHLRADLQSIMALIETDVRRAGYGGDDYLVGVSGTKAIDINSNHDCIVYYYNHDDSTTLQSSNKMAFSLQKTSIKFKTNVDPIADSACAVSSGWTAISDDTFIDITALTFTEYVTSNAVATMRNIDIKLTGELASDSSYSHSINTRVQVRNIELIH